MWCNKHKEFCKAAEDCGRDDLLAGMDRRAAELLWSDSSPCSGGTVRDILSILVTEFGAEALEERRRQLQEGS